MNPTMSGVAALFATAFFAASASAHGAWIAPSHGALAVIYGHGGDNDAYDPAKLTLLQGCDKAGACADIPSRAHDSYVDLERPDGVALIKVEFDNGYWSQGGDGRWVNKPKNEVENAKQGGHYVKYGTFVLSNVKGGSAPLGMALEIVPLTDPLALHAGDELPVQVLKNGKPLAGAEVMIDYTAGEMSVATDANGEARVPVRNQGLNVLAVSATDEPHPQPEMADETGLVSTLSFVLGHKH